MRHFPLVIGLLATGAFAQAKVTIPQFEAAINAARLESSPGGISIVRSEARGAANIFLYDDGVIDADEKAYLAYKLSDGHWLSNVTGTARKYFFDFAELNDRGPVAPLRVNDFSAPVAQLFGATGALTNAAWPKEGFIPYGAGITNQATLQATYLAAYEASASYFDPVTVRELLVMLSGRLESGTPSIDEIEGAQAFIVEISRNSNRLFVAPWSASSRGGQPGDLGGFVVAAVSSDRRFVRFVEFHTWTE